MHPRLRLLFRGLLILAPLGCGAQTLYDFGNPTADEQLYIELINRARANPTAEGVRLAAVAGEGNTAETDITIKTAVTQFGVNLTKMKSEFAGYAAAAPLAPNAALMNFARQHSQWMLDNGVQSHDQGSLTFANRVAALAPTPYNYSGFSENVYATAKSVWYGHAGFQIDWGSDDGGTDNGMQSKRGHRKNIHDIGAATARREIGVGVKYGSHPNGNAGPTAVTQDFSTQASTYAFVSGVAYYDLDGDNFYDPGEGISGLTVNVTNHTSGFNCNTAIGGGWVVPVNNAAATRTVAFSGLNTSQSTAVVFPGSVGIKHDLKLTYAAPTISSTNTANVGTAKSITFPATPGATSYKWHRWTTAAAAAIPCDNTSSLNLGNSQTLGNTVVSTTVKDTGAGSLWLANFQETRGSRWLEFSTLYRASASPAIAFRSRLRYSTLNEKYKIQAREEGAVNWVDIYSQTGSGTSGEVSFVDRTSNSNLAGFANKTFRVRLFVEADSNLGAYSSSPDPSVVGWFVDNITFTNIQQLENDVVTTLNTTSGSYTPASTGTILQSVAPVITNREFPGAYQTLTVAAAVTPTFATWATNLETANSLPAGTLAAANGDHDKDGRVNLLEYAFGTSPVTASESAPRWPKIYSSTPTSLVMEYQVDTTLTDLTMTPQATLTLGSWFGPSDVGRPTGFVDALISTNGNIQTRRATLPLSAGQKGFMRVRATQN